MVVSLKRKLIYSLIVSGLFICGGLLIEFIYLNESGQNGENTALAVVYNSAEELYANSNLIILGNIGDYEETITRWGDKRVVIRLYDVAVKKFYPILRTQNLSPKIKLFYPYQLVLQ